MVPVVGGKIASREDAKKAQESEETFLSHVIT